jgi:hypothetical protein
MLSECCFHEIRALLPLPKRTCRRLLLPNPKPTVHPKVGQVRVITVQVGDGLSALGVGPAEQDDSAHHETAAPIYHA